MYENYSKAVVKYSLGYFWKRLEGVSFDILGFQIAVSQLEINYCFSNTFWLYKHWVKYTLY